MKPTKALLIDDDRELGELLMRYLERFNIDVIHSLNPGSGLEQLREHQPDIVILDVMLPEMDGFQVIKEIRRFHSVPVLMLTARGELTDRIVGLELGADDYLAKPFEPRELVARINSILRRADRGPRGGLITSENLTVDMQKRTVCLDSMPIDVSTTEFDLLALLLERAGSTLSRDEIMDKIRGIEWDAYNRSIDIAVSRLRSKLKEDPKRPRFIKTIRGAGYMFIGELAEHD